MGDIRDAKVEIKGGSSNEDNIKLMDVKLVIDSLNKIYTSIHKDGIIVSYYANLINATELLFDLMNSKVLSNTELDSAYEEVNIKNIEISDKNRENNQLRDKLTYFKERVTIDEENINKLLERIKEYESIIATMGDNGLTIEELNRVLFSRDRGELIHKNKQYKLDAKQLKIEHDILEEDKKRLKEERNNLSKEIEAYKNEYIIFEESKKFNDSVGTKILGEDLSLEVNKLIEENTNLKRINIKLSRENKNKTNRVDNFKDNKLSCSKDKPAKRFDVDDGIIRYMYESGRTPNSIGKEFGMTQSAIIYRLKNMGIYVVGGRNRN